MPSSFWRNLWDRLWRRKGQPKKRRRGEAFLRQPNGPLSLERLECRIAPAITASITGGGVLEVLGTSGADTIKLRLATADTSKLEILDNTTPIAGSPFTIASFTSVNVLAG